MNTRINNLNRTQRERLTILYCAAFERGDLELINKVLENAAEDDELAQMIFQTSLELIGQDEREMADKILFDLEAKHVGQIVQQKVSNELFESGEEIQLPPVTVRSVLANLQEDSSINTNVRNEAAKAQQDLKAGDVSLPADLSLHGVENFLRSVGLHLSESAKSLFRRVAIFKSIGLENQEIRLAATRRQHSPKRKQKKNNEKRTKQ